MGQLERSSLSLLIAVEHGAECLLAMDAELLSRRPKINSDLKFWSLKDMHSISKKGN